MSSLSQEIAVRSRTGSGRRLAVLVVIVFGLVLSACGGSDDTGSGSDSDLAVGIFVDNAFGDGDFFDQAAAAEGSLQSEFGASVATYEGQLEAQNFLPLLQDAAEANDIVFVLGFEAIDQMIAVAEANQDTTLVFVDAVIDHPDIVSAVFPTAEGCFMAGALAATVNADAGSEVAGFIGGVNAPVIENCESGYTQGVSHVDSNMQVAAQYVGSFVDPGKGSEIARVLEGEGAFSIFSYAGLSGAGAFDAAKSGVEIAPIGVVADKSNLAPGKVPGSLLMGVDKVIVEVTRLYVDGDLEKGSVHSFGFKTGGWEMIYDANLLTADEIASLEALEAQIVSGGLTITE